MVPAHLGLEIEEEEAYNAFGRGHLPGTLRLRRALGDHPEVLLDSMPALPHHLERSRWAGVFFAALLTAALLPSPAQAAPVAPASPSHEPRDRGVVRTEEPAALPSPMAGRVRGLHPTNPPVQEVYVFVDSLDGRNLKDEAGWTHYDDSAKPTQWHLDTLLACQGHSWWCGRVDSSWVFDSNRAGYDNDWGHALMNSVNITSISPGTQITIAFRHRFSAEPNFDFGHVEVLDPFDSWTAIAEFTGEVPGGGGCDSFTVAV